MTATRILYLDLDSLRPDHLGCYGYGRPTSPVIDSVAAEGIRLTNYFASDTPCVPSRAALFSARPGIESGVVMHENNATGSTLRYGPAERYGDAPMLMHALAAAGVKTVSVSSFADRHFAGWFHFGFREFYLPSLKGGNEDAPEVNAAALPWLREHAKEDNWFVHLNYWDAHTLYTEPLRYTRMMAEFPAPPWPDAEAIAKQQTDVGLRTARTLWGDGPHEGYGRSRVPTMPDAIASRADFGTLIGGYDGAIRYLDEHLAAIFGELQAQGVWDETAVIISADHGEAFGELGQYMEHGAAVPAVHRVPLIVRWPGLTDAAAGESRDALALGLDFAPTILAGLGLEAPAGWAGRSLIPLLQGENFAERDHLVLSHGLHTRQRSVFDGRWLFIRTYHPGTYSYPPRLLFDTAVDPYLTRDLAGEHSSEYTERVADLEHKLLAWEARYSHDPLPLVQDFLPPSPDAAAAYLKRLERDGRDAASEALRASWARLGRDYGWPRVARQSADEDTES